jgi:hypothetical protein
VIQRMRSQVAPSSSNTDRFGSDSKPNWLATILHAIDFDDHWLQIALLVFMLLIYGALLSAQFLFWHDSQMTLTFNSMLVHLMRGRFDVDPQIVGNEGFLRNGRVYAYFGIFCALIRFPLWIVRRMDWDMTVWSCLIAVCLAAMAKVRAVLLIRRQGQPNRSSQWAIRLMLAYILLGGSEIAYLRPSIYQEVIFWAAAFGAIFVYFAIKGLLTGSFSTTTLSWMGLCAGLSVLTRISTGIGLTLALLSLLFVIVGQSSHWARQERQTMLRRLWRALAQRRILIPLGIFAVFVAATAAVNYFRWGNPATFENFDLYLGNKGWPDRVPLMHAYGLFNIRRIPFGLSYYFFPVWALHGHEGQLLFQPLQTRLFDDVELPPSSFLITDLLPLCFIGFFALALRRGCSGIRLRAARSMAIAAGLLAPCMLMLMSAWMDYRYRMEFYPEIDLLAFLGLYLTVTDSKMLAEFGRWRKWFVGATAVSILGAFMAFTLSEFSNFGRSQQYLGNGLVSYYSQQLRQIPERLRHLEKFAPRRP